jgi:signal transduction histidine kinase
VACRVVDELEGAHPDAVIHLDAVGDTAGSWDGDRLAQVISNLVSNAIRHGKADAPVVVRIDGEDPSRVVATFWNDGAIPEDVLPSIFDPFVGTRHRRTASTGLGLGLYITEEIVRGHAGRVEVRSSPEQGTLFTVVLPREPRTGS